MYVRLTTLHGDPEAMGAAVHYVRTRLRPAIDPLAGSLGLEMRLNRESGHCLVTTGWTDEGALRHADNRLGPRDAELGRILDRDLRVDVLERALGHQTRPGRPGFWTRFTAVTLRPALLDRGIWLAETQLLPGLGSLPGYTSLLVLTDRASGRFVSSTTFESRAALEAGRPDAAAYSADLLSQLGAPEWETAELEVEIASIVPPVSVSVPTQRTAEAPVDERI